MDNLAIEKLRSMAFEASDEDQSNFLHSVADAILAVQPQASAAHKDSDQYRFYGDFDEAGVRRLEQASAAQSAPVVPDGFKALLDRIVPRIDAGGPNPIDPELHHCEWTLYQERERIHAEFESVLAAAPAQPAAQGECVLGGTGISSSIRGAMAEAAPAQSEVQRLREALPYLRNAVAEASASGVAQLAVVSTKPDGSGNLVCKFECVEFMADLAAVVGAGPQTEDDDARAEARKFLQRNGIASTWQEVEP